MIWHLLEVWALLVVMFALGCVLGALLYGAIARGPLASAQGVLADAAGDVLERLKVRAGLAPAWRRGRMRRVERAVPETELRVEPRLAEAAAGDLSGPYAAPYVSSDVPAVELPVSEEDRARLSTISADGGAGEAATFTGRSSSAMRVADDGLVPKRPPGLSGPRGGAPDNLQRIKGIGRRNEAMLNSLGIYHFGQIAAWTPAEIRWIGQYLAYPERIERDDWPGQATLIAMGQDTGFEKSADRRRRRRREEREFASRMEHAVETDALAATIGPPRSDDIAAESLADRQADMMPEDRAEAVGSSGADSAPLPEQAAGLEEAIAEAGTRAQEIPAKPEESLAPLPSAEDEVRAERREDDGSAAAKPKAKAGVARGEKNRKARHRRRVRKKTRPD